jgi:putative hemolysin
MDWAALADSGPYLIAFGALLAVSGFFSGTEVAMFSLRRVDREQMARSQRRADLLVHRLVSVPRKLIATVLIGNEIVNVTMSATMAVVAAQVFTGYRETAVAILTTLIVLPFVLLFGEITPKTVAIKTSVGWSRKAARPVYFFYVVATPIRLVVQGIASLLLRALGAGPPPSPAPPSLGEDELKTLVDAGSAEGEVGPRERQVIHRVLEFTDKRVAQVMKPAKDSFLLAYDLPLKRMLAEITARGYSRVPIYYRSRDNIRGILYAKDLVLSGAGLMGTRRLDELLHKPLFVPRSMPLKRLFDVFNQRKIHMGIVVDEYGTFVGIVTMEDLLEELFGPIRDEKETPERLPSADARAAEGEPR